jgi:hypothetical protein
MPGQSRLDPYDERIVGPIDLDAGRSEALSDDAHRASAADQPVEAESDLLAGQPIPVFFSVADEEPQPPAPEAASHKYPPRRRILQAAMLAAAGVAIVLAILSRDYRPDLFANAGASLPARTAGPPNAASSLAPVQSAADDPVWSATAAGAPTRGEIAAALRGAYQGLATAARKAEARRPDADPETLFKRFQAWGAEHNARAGPASRQR